MVGFIPNPYGVQSPIGQAMQNIASAMFARPAVNRDLEDARIADYRAQVDYNRARTAKEQAEVEQMNYFQQNGEKMRQSGIAQLIAGASGLDQEKAGALALNNRLGFELIPEFNDMNPVEQQLPLRAVNMAIGASQMNPAMKAGTGGAGQTDDIIKGFSGALDTLNKQAFYDGTISKEAQQRMGFLNGRNRFDAVGTDGLMIDQLETSPIAAMIGNDMNNVQVAGKVKANNALTRQRNTAAQLNTNNARVADLKGDMIANTGSISDVVVADAGSPTGYSYMKPDSSKLSGAPAPKGTGTATTGANGKPLGVVYTANKPEDIDKAVESALGINSSPLKKGEKLSSRKQNIPLSANARATIRKKVSDIATQAGLQGKFTDEVVSEALRQTYAENPNLFDYNANVTDTFLGFEVPFTTDPKTKNRFDEAGIANAIVGKPTTPPANKAGKPKAPAQLAPADIENLLNKYGDA